MHLKSILKDFQIPVFPSSKKMHRIFSETFALIIIVICFGLLPIPGTEKAVASETNNASQLQSATIDMPELSTEAADTLRGRVVQVALGDNHSAALRADGSLWMWGDNSSGQLGNGTNSATTKPTLVLNNVKEVALGGKHSAAIKKDGSLWMWGDNTHGQLGDDTTTNKNTPKKIMDGVKHISLGKNHSAAIKNDGTLWMWGSNGTHQIGDGSSATQKTPLKIMSNVSQVALGGFHSAALKTDGTLWMWGYNNFGQIGNERTGTQETPAQILTDVRQVSLGDYHSAAVKTDGTLWCWGHNNNGQIGDGTTWQRSTPVQIMTGVIQVSLGGSHSAALRNDNALWLWGANTNGQLGFDISISSCKTPGVAIRNVTFAALGANHSAAIDQSQGALWCWGLNDDGQIGDGQKSNIKSPKKVLDGGAKLDAKNITLAKTSYVYSGKSIKPAVTVKFNGKKLKKGKDYTVKYKSNKKAGVAKAIVSGVGLYAGTAKKSFKITPASISKAKGSFSTLTYNGKVRNPSISLKYNKKKLKNKTDYKLTCSNTIKKVGTYKIKIVGKGNFKNSTTKSFDIIPKASSITSAQPLYVSSSGAAKVTWAKVSDQCDGYELWLSPNSKFTSSATKKKEISASSSYGINCSFSGDGLLKSTTYYVKIRTYKFAGSKWYYSNWSPVKTVRTLG